MKRIWLALAAATLVAVLAIGLVQAGGNGGGEANPESAAATPEQTERRLAGAPPELAAVHAQANQLLGGGPRAFKARLAELRGHPVVVNKWASWCGPCRAEFPEFQRAAIEHGKEVAFLGVNSMDNHDEAVDFLDRYPVSYPSYEDPGGTVAQVFNGAAAFPTTAFYDRSGKLAYIRQGQYPNRAKLEEDIRRYAMR